MVDGENITGALHCLVEEGELGTFVRFSQARIPVSDAGEPSPSDQSGNDPGEQAVEQDMGAGCRAIEEKGCADSEEWDAGEDVAELVLEEEQCCDVHGNGREEDEGSCGVPAFPGDKSPGDGEEEQDVVDGEVRLVAEGRG